MGRENLGEFELIVLLAVLRLGPSRAHTLAVVEEIRSRSGRSVQRAAAYVTLQRLEKKGLVESWLADPREERGGKRRRHVRLLPAGLAAVRSARGVLEDMWSGLEQALEEK
ncbi:MAG: helix-turn-helix transcriptional regulator [Acidobacteriota bacterium]